MVDREKIRVDYVVVGFGLALAVLLSLYASLRVSDYVVKQYVEEVNELKNEVGKLRRDLNATRRAVAGLADAVSELHDLSGSNREAVTQLAGEVVRLSVYISSAHKKLLELEDRLRILELKLAGGD